MADVDSGSDIAAQWDALFAKQADDISANDITATREWAISLAACGEFEVPPVILVAKQDGEVIAVLPVYLERRSLVVSSGIYASSLSEIYSGRSGLLVEGGSIDRYSTAIGAMAAAPAPWDVFMFTVVKHAASMTAIKEAVQQHGFTTHILDSNRSPYIDVQETWEEQSALLPKKFRWTIRKGEKDLRSQGSLTYEYITDKDQLPYFVEAMLDVERASWKEEANTSITSQPFQERFYADFLPRAADKGWFSGHLLKLDDRPIAHVCGLQCKNIFYDLKESYSNAHRRYSPGHVLKRFVFDELAAAGTRIYDFMGACEAYKMKWTDKTYERVTVAVFNRTLNGRLARFRSVASSLLQRRARA